MSNPHFDSNSPDERNESRPGFFARWRDRDHTQGSLVVSLAALALPLIATSLCGVVFQLTDLKLVSGIGESAVTAVVVTNQSLRQLFLMLVTGSSFGAQSLIAYAVGEGAGERADQVAGQTVLMGLVLSVFIATIGLLFPAQMLAAMNVSPEVLEIGVPYVRLVFVLNFGFVFVNLFNAILNGAGDTTTPFVIAALQTAVALVSEWALIYGHVGIPALGIRGVALGVVVGQLVSILLISRVLFGGHSRIHVRRQHLRPRGSVIRQIVDLSWPPAVHMIGRFLVTVIFIRLMGDFGGAAQTAYAIGLRLSLLGPIICFPVAGAVATLVGQSLGAMNVRRAWRAMGLGILVHGCMMWSLGVGIFLFRVELLELFTQDPEVIDIGSRQLVWQAGSFGMLGFYFVLIRALQGAGDVLVPMIISLTTSLLFALPLGFYLAQSRGMGPDGVFIAQFAGTVSVTVLTALWMATGRWTTARTRAIRKLS